MGSDGVPDISKPHMKHCLTVEIVFACNPYKPACDFLREGFGVDLRDYRTFSESDGIFTYLKYL